MPDSAVLYGPDGASPVQLGSFFELPRDQPDYGAEGLLRQGITDNSISEGGRLTFESYGPRNMKFALMLGSHAAWGGLTGIESLLRFNARPGGWLDVQPHGVASAEFVRFDIVAGKYEENYHQWIGYTSHRRGMLYLTTDPLGYWPTYLILASAASIGNPGVLSFTGASVIGDVPGLGRITIIPTFPTTFHGGSNAPDLVAWSLAGRASQVAMWPQASLAGMPSSTLAADGLAPASWAVGVPSWTHHQWTPTVWNATISAALEPAYRGRFRAFTWVKHARGRGRYALDAIPLGVVAPPMASANSVGTAQAASHMLNWKLVDLGEIELPPTPSGIAQDYVLRMWQKIEEPHISGRAGYAGLYLMSLDGAAGVLNRGLAAPTISQPTLAAFRIDARGKRVYAGAPGAYTPATGPEPLADLSLHYDGGYPLVSPSQNRLDFYVGARPRGQHDASSIQTMLIGWSTGHAQVPTALNPFRYYPFSQSSGSWINNVPLLWTTNTPTLAATGGGGPTTLQPGPFQAPPSANNFSCVWQGGAWAYGSAQYLPASHWSIEFWFKTGGPSSGMGGGSYQTMIYVGTPASGLMCNIGIIQPTGLEGQVLFSGASGIDLAMGDIADTQFLHDGQFHHCFVTHNDSEHGHSIYLDGKLHAQETWSQSPDFGQTGQSLHVALDHNLGNHFHFGALAHLAMYWTVIGPSQVWANYVRGRTGQQIDAARFPQLAEYPHNPWGDPPHQANHNHAFSAVSIEYQPRFAFLRGI